MRPEQAALLGYGDRVHVDPRYKDHARPGHAAHGQATVFETRPDGTAIGKYMVTLALPGGEHVEVDAHWLEKAR